MGKEPIDLEELARLLVRSRTSDAEILQRLSEAADSGHWARAVLSEVHTTESLDGVTSSSLKRILLTPEAGATAGEAGLGCRGEGDFYIHGKIAQIAGSGGVIGVPDQDDSGVVRIPKRGKGEQLVAVAVDGVHSRLDHFPFLMGFHVARATLRDIVVSGARPLALFSDIHIGNDGDVGKIFDFTAGATTVGEALGFPLVAGSTLRIGGDMVLGSRLTGCIGAVGVVEHLTPRKGVRSTDVLVMTEGAGGGTVATAALFNGKGEVAGATINLKTLKAGLALLDSRLIKQINSMTDVTNGGIRGDAFHMSEVSGVGIVLDQKAFNGLVDDRVLGMLRGLDIDPLGVSIDTILLSVGKSDVKGLVEFFDSVGVRADIVGKAKKGKGVTLVKEDGTSEVLGPRFREAPYTPIKKLVDQPPHDLKGQKKAIDKAMRQAEKKKRMVLKMLEPSR